MLARLGELAALVLDFVEQPDILDGDASLVGECRHQLDLPVGEGPHLISQQSDHANRPPFTQQWHAENRAEADCLLHLGHGVFGIGFDIGNVDGSRFGHGAANHAAAARLVRNAFKKIGDVRGETVGRGVVVGRAHLPGDGTHFRAA